MSEVGHGAGRIHCSDAPHLIGPKRSLTPDRPIEFRKSELLLKPDPNIPYSKRFFRTRRLASLRVPRSGLRNGSGDANKLGAKVRERGGRFWIV